jgi:glycosyltransferase involved in cell wall biosynthesis
MSNEPDSRDIAHRSWLIVPLYNEEQVVGDVIRQALQTFPRIVCVDDGSADNSVSQARLAGAVVLEHVVNLGQGAALQTGINFALGEPNSDFFVTFDADGQHRTEDALAMVTRLASEDLDVIVGSRFLDKRTSVSFLKRAVLRVATAAQRLSTGVKLTDAHNGLRALNVHAASSIRITQNRMAHASEIISDISRLKLRYAEQPVHIIYTDYSRAKGQSLWNSINILNDMIIK